MKKLLTFSLCLLLFSLLSFTYVNAGNDFKVKEHIEPLRSNELILSIEPREKINDILGFLVDEKKLNKADNKFQLWNNNTKYYLDTENSRLYILEPNSDATLTFELKTGIKRQFKFVKGASRNNRIIEETNIYKPQAQNNPKKEEESKKKESSSKQKKKIEISDVANSFDFVIKFSNKDDLNNIKEVKINDKGLAKKDNRLLVFQGGYYIDKDNSQIYMQDPRNTSKLTFIYEDASTYNFTYDTSKKVGSRITAINEEHEQEEQEQEPNNKGNELVTENDLSPEIIDSKKEEATLNDKKELKGKDQEEKNKNKKNKNNSNLKITDEYDFNDLMLKFSDKSALENIKEIKQNENKLPSKTSKWQTFSGGYYIDKENSRIYLREPNEKVNISLVYNDDSIYTFTFDNSKPKGSRVILLQEEESLENEIVNQPEDNKADEVNIQKPTNIPEKELKIVDQESLLREFSIKFLEKEDLENLKELKINNIKSTLKPNKYQTFTDGYSIDKDKSQIDMQEPKDKSTISFVYDNDVIYNFTYDRSKNKGSRLIPFKKDDKVKQYIKLKLVGDFEAALVGQQKYDAVSSASTGVTANKNSNAKLQFVKLVNENDKINDTDWADFHTDSELYTKALKDIKIELDEESGMKAVYNRLDSSITLNGTPKKAGNYTIKVSATDYLGRKIESNALAFNVYSSNEKLIDNLKIEKSVQTKDKKYMYTMEPWFMQEFSDDQTVTVPKEIKAIFGSHTSGTYGELGKYSTTGTYQTLIIDKDTDLTLVNMLLKSSVKIVVKSGGTLRLDDSAIYGEIIVEENGKFSMNYDNYNKKFKNGASINGKLVLKDGAILLESMIYSNTNFVTDAGKNGKANKNVNPVMEVLGTVNVKGNVLIKGDEAPTGDDPLTNKPYTAQPAVKIKDATLNIDEGVTFAAYGGGKFITSTYGAPAIILENGKIVGDGNLIAVAGSSFGGDAPNAVDGNGEISVKKAILQGGNAHRKNTKPGLAYNNSISISDATIGYANSGKLITAPRDNDQELYWNDITQIPNLSEVEYGKEFINKSENIETNKQDTKVEDTKVEDTNVENNKVEDNKIENSEIENTEVENTEVENTNVEDTNVENTKVQDTESKDTIVESNKSEDTNKNDASKEDSKLSKEEDNNLNSADNKEINKADKENNTNNSANIASDTSSNSINDSKDTSLNSISTNTNNIVNTNTNNTVNTNTSSNISSNTTAANTANTVNEVNTPIVSVQNNTANSISDTSVSNNTSSNTNSNISNISTSNINSSSLSTYDTGSNTNNNTNTNNTNTSDIISNKNNLVQAPALNSLEQVEKEAKASKAEIIKKENKETKVVLKDNKKDEVSKSDSKSETNIKEDKQTNTKDVKETKEANETEASKETKEAKETANLNTELNKESNKNKVNKMAVASVAIALLAFISCFGFWHFKIK